MRTISELSCLGDVLLVWVYTDILAVHVAAQL